MVIGGQEVIAGECLKVMRGMEGDSFDSVVTDPPAGISFMGKAWDGDKGGRHQWVAWMAEVLREAMRLVKPGGHALVWALPRTSHWTGWAAEDAGWEVRDRVTHLFGNGFPKSLDVGKAIDKAAGAEREVVGVAKGTGKQNPSWNGTEAGRTENSLKPEYDLTAPATEAAREWDGWGTALKPACEDWWLLRKPMSERNVAANVLKWGTGALNIRAGRVETGGGNGPGERRATENAGRRKNDDSREFPSGIDYVDVGGRWPPHVVHDGSEAVLARFAEAGERGESGGEVVGTGREYPPWHCYNGGWKSIDKPHHHDSGSAARFFPEVGFEAADEDSWRFLYTAKAGRAEREAGLMAGETPAPRGRPINRDDPALVWAEQRGLTARNHHPTVKPLALMRWLVRLITPPGGRVLDPFLGSGTTLMACAIEGMRGVGIEREAEYLQIAEARIAWAVANAERIRKERPAVKRDGEGQLTLI